MKMIRVTSTLLLWGSAVAFGCSSGDSGGSSTPGQTVCGEAATTGIATADACIQENCCASFAPCHQDAACRACIAGSGSGCDGNTLFQAFSACVAANDCFGSGGTGGKGGAGGGASGSGGATACAEHKDCKGQLCVAGTCKPCATTSECVSAYSAIYECKDGKCQSTACTVDEDCASKGMLCRNHVCSACETNSDCTSSSAYPGYQCLLGRCSDGDCTASADCPSDAPICGGKSECRGCQTDAECLEKKGTASGYVCDTQSGLCPEGDCSPNGKGCGASKDQICEDYHCRECTDDTDCQTVFGAGFLCMTGHCIAAECQNDLDCSGGQRICDTATHKCRDCLTNSQECGTGKVCGSDGKCHTGNCYPPGVACCDLDGNIRLDSYKCYQASVKTEYRCDSTACGAAAQELKYYRYCDGVTSECGDNNVQPSGDWETISDCSTNQICESGATFAQCTHCPKGCSNGACNADCMPGTACCNDDGTYKQSPCCSAGTPLPKNTKCDNAVQATEYRCGTLVCSGTREKREQFLACDGNTSQCGPSTVWSEWSIDRTCNGNGKGGYCDTAANDCVSCTNGCSGTPPTCNPCPADQCTIDGKCYANGAKRNDVWNNCHVCDTSNKSAWSSTSCNSTDGNCHAAVGACGAMGLCSYAPQAGKCIVAGRCKASDAPLVGTPGAAGYCSRCLPTANPTAWSPRSCSAAYVAPPGGVTEAEILGTAPPTTNLSASCPDGWVGYKLDIARDQAGFPRRVNLVCRLLTKDGTLWTHPITGDQVSGWVGNNSNLQYPIVESVQCSEGAFLTGVWGWTGGGIDRLGIVCGSRGATELGLTGQYVRSNLIGAGPSATIREGVCPGNMGVSGVTAYWDPGAPYLLGLAFECVELSLRCCYDNATVPPVPIGAVDYAGPNGVWGWSCATVEPEKSIDVHVYFDGPYGTGQMLGMLKAEEWSELGVNTACGGGGRHRWSMSMPQLPPGTHTVHAYGVNGSSIGLLSNSGMSFVLP